MESGADMKPNSILGQPERTFATQRADWFDDIHDTVLILESREYEENGLPQRPEVSYQVA
jgi:hypothetical protein